MQLIGGADCVILYCADGYREGLEGITVGDVVTSSHEKRSCSETQTGRSEVSGQ